MKVVYVCILFALTKSLCDIMFIILNDKAKKHRLETKKENMMPLNVFFLTEIESIFFALHKNSTAKIFSALHSKQKTELLFVVKH
ncbi:hypothetical protein EDC94DRAFT_612328 [Helicostylum pulchrum]|nr:hypothetical protein EDC94DRAFT_612328 [Helicostylum pulchrum]